MALELPHPSKLKSRWAFEKLCSSRLHRSLFLSPTLSLAFLFQLPWQMLRRFSFLPVLRGNSSGNMEMTNLRMKWQLTEPCLQQPEYRSCSLWCCSWVGPGILDKEDEEIVFIGPTAVGDRDMDSSYAEFFFGSGELRPCLHYHVCR